MRSIVSICCALVLLFACKTSTTEKEKKEIVVNKKDRIEIIPSNYIDTAFITEENVWIRSEEGEGEMIGKVGKGTKCFILKQGKSDSIRGVVDYWYQVVAGGKEGWVFGSQLSIRMAKLKAFEETLNYFLNAYNTKSIEDLNDYVHPQYGISFGFVVCGDDKEKMEKAFNDVKSYPDFISFDTLQQFTKAFPDVSCKNPKNDVIPKYIGNNNWSEKGCYWKEVSKGEVKLVSTETIYEFYFKAIESNWFLVRIEQLDCK
jgi:hypothetical protein